MARGNQRELARKKNMKKQQDAKKGKRSDDGLTPQQRRERDAQRLQEKAAKKAAMKAEQEKGQKKK
ncbi:small EDRK-rich factor 2 [Salpingoeca rosetta]|uniref:Small EDRK-rich factor 2 n=1 Tax=Salpingoeca rosetta (strain ATCC 50818 / BSB-021) TaxID=946362 RepID=F2UJ60_SALR5|nr:small EDRK-rich factor 2 [Salpingoeca rosetta]EGD77008.1 small EDRK-rich factor 2 [Salpingoeca rosetta]|eukprot:XP_004990848.1 small EDRK-rich factor 2 [Salpingoeca rosetta]